MPVFAGLDLAWTPHRESGLCVVEAKRHPNGDRWSLLRLDARVWQTAELADYLSALGPDVVAAIDAPLLVGPARTAERRVGQAFGRYKASAHSANEQLLRATCRMAGPDLASALITAGFEFDPLALSPGSPGRFALEVYPHAFHVVAFSLQERIAYKRKKGRGVDACRHGLVALQRHLQRLIETSLPELLPALRPILSETAVRSARGGALKRVEDQLDALTCAIAAWRAWKSGLTAGDILGDPTTGCVAVPGMASDRRFG